MVVLGIETATLQGGAALVDEGGLLAEAFLNVSITHSERLLPTIDWLLRQARVRLGDLSGIGVSIGPGSFTGLRIGLSTAKGFAMATGLPVVAVPTLEAMAWTLPRCRDQICPLLDARKAEVYAALFGFDGGVLQRRMQDAALPPEDLIARIDEPTVFLGDGVRTYRTLLRDRLGALALFLPPALMGPRPATVAELGRDRLDRGERDDPASLTPRYLRASEAELKRRR